MNLSNIDPHLHKEILLDHLLMYVHLAHNHLPYFYGFKLCLIFSIILFNCLHFARNVSFSLSNLLYELFI